MAPDESSKASESQEAPVSKVNTPLVEAAKEALELQKPIEVSTTVPTAEDTTAKVVENNEVEEIFVAARTPQEMNVAQQKLIAWADGKIGKLKEEVKAAEVNLELAKKRKWATAPFKRIVAVAQKKVEFYEKVQAALQAGYTIIPDMPMDIFAIRTTKKNPKKNVDSGSTQFGNRLFVMDQQTNSPPLGEGKFVSNRAIEEEHTWTGKDKDQKPIPMALKKAVEFDPEIDFPFRMAKPVVLNDTAKALSQKFFDQIGVAPSTRRERRPGDPMVIGRILYKQGYHEKAVAFLISWFIDSKDL